MIEATCTACGTVNRIADADVPLGAKFVNCASCKSRVGIPAGAAKTKVGGAGTALDFADLPAPRRSSALGGDAGKPSPKSGLAAAGPNPMAMPEPELPAPRNKKPMPAAAPPGSLDLDDILAAPDGGADLPAPRAKQDRSHSDLPAPRGAAPSGGSPVRAGGGRALTDIPIPGVADTSPLADLPSPKPKNAMQDLADLPAPRPKAPPPGALPPKIPVAPPPSVGLADLPGPKSKAPPGITDLPGPKPRTAVPPIPVPPSVPPAQARGGGGAGIVDLPMPKPGMTDLPAPKPGQDLVAPKGYFEDLPQPAAASRQNQGQAGPDLPAPKGFFEDLPQPAKTQSQQNQVAPKGFFDDLPGRPNQQKPEVPAPKGFFDDLPGRPNQQRPDVPAPKGFFDDLPKPAPTASQSGIKLDSLDLAPPEDMGIELDLAEDRQAPRAKPASVAPAPGPSNQFDDLDLSSPSPVSFQKGSATASRSQGGPGPSPVAMITPESAAAAAAAVQRPVLPPISPKSADAALELEGVDPRRGGVVAQAPTKLGPKERGQQKKLNEADRAERSKRTRKIAGFVLLALLALGGAGYFFYQRHTKAQAHENAVNEQLGLARKSMAQSQWAKAMVTSAKAAELDKGNGEALGIRAEALFALGITEGYNPARFGQARKSLNDALQAAKTHAALDRAQALSPLAAGQAEKALPKLKQLAGRAPKDVALQLYLGWAYAQLGESDNALKAFDAAAAAPSTKLHALFGRAKVKLANADLEGARADFGAVIEMQKDHIGAQIGMASSLAPSQSQQQEADLLAILALKDVEKKEPRAALQAWLLTAELAAKNGRFDVARERYRKALAIQQLDLGALTGLAEVELRDNKPDVAREMIEKALKAAPTDLKAQIVAAEVAITQKKLEEAGTKIEALAKRTPPPPVIEQARIKLLSARLLEAKGNEQDAIEAYLEAAKLAKDLDLTPTLVAVAKLTELADKAVEAKDDARASELRKLADSLLGELADAAERDPQLALTLGMAYMQANDPVKAESWLRKVTEKKPKDVDALYQLARALTKQGKAEEAITRLRNAVDLDPTRTEIGLELARTYEGSKPPRLTDAEKLYDKLLGAKEPSLELRARAGRFYARAGQMVKASEQGAKILEQQEGHPAGLYLKGEGLLVAKPPKIEAARKLLVQASDADPEPQYLDARGRASEAFAKESGNTAYQDDALRAYAKAVEKDPTLFSSWLGQGRLYVTRKEDAKALDPLPKAWALKNTAEVALLLGTALKNVGNQPGNAAGWLAQSFKMEPNAETAFLLGELYTDPKLNNPKAAIDALENATRLAHDADKKSGTPLPTWYPEALYRLGDIHRNLNHLKEAKSAWNKYLGTKPTGPKARLQEVTQAMNTYLKDL